MGRSSGDVGGYRGRRTITDILRFIAIALAVVVGLMLAVMLYLQKYLVYTDDGVRLELPPFLQMFRQGEEESNPPGSASLPEPGSVSLIEEPDVSQQEPDPVPEPDPEPKDVGSALQLSVAEARDGSAAAKLEAAGAQVLVLEVKDQMGQLAWHAEPAIAGWSSVNGPQQAAEALKRWNEGEIYTVARVHCFRDDTVPYYNNNFALRWAGNDWNWYDELGLRWTSPGKEEIRAYNAALCGELAAMGFDEIVLEEFYFPIQGKLDTIRRGESYDSSQFTALVEDFLTKVQEAVEPYGTKISLRVGRETLTGGENVSGVTTQMIEQYAYRVWVEQDGLSPAPAALLEQAGITGGKERLALIVSELEEESGVFQAVFPDKDNM